MDSRYSKDLKVTVIDASKIFIKYSSFSVKIVSSL